MHRVVIVACEGVQSLDVAGRSETGSDTRLGDDVTVMSADGGEVATESTVRLTIEPFDTAFSHHPRQLSESSTP